IDGSFDRTVEDRPVPRWQFLAEEVVEASPSGIAADRGSGRAVTDPVGIVVATPDDDRRVMAEEIDGLAGLATRLFSDRASVTPLERKILPDEGTSFVRSGVYLGAGDVTEDPNQVVIGVFGGLDVGAELIGCGVGEQHACRPEVDPFREQADAIDVQNPTTKVDLAKADPAGDAVAARSPLRCWPRTGGF